MVFLGGEWGGEMQQELGLPGGRMLSGSRELRWHVHDTVVGLGAVGLAVGVWLWSPVDFGPPLVSQMVGRSCPFRSGKVLPMLSFGTNENVSTSGESRALSVHEQNQSLLIPTPGFPELVSSHLSEWRLRS